MQRHTRRESQRQLAVEVHALAALHALSTRLLGAPNLQCAAQQTLDTLVALVHADMGTLQYYDAELGGLRFVATYGFPDTVIHDLPVIYTDFHSTCARAAARRQSVSVEDFHSELQSPHRDIAAQLGYRAAYSTPLFVACELVGVITLHSRRPRRFSARERRWVDLAATQAALLMERARAAEQLRQSEERHRIALQAACLGTWTFDPKTHAVSGDDRARDIFGLDRNQLQFKEFLSVVHPEDREGVADAVSEAIGPRGTGSYHREYRVLWPDGSLRWVAVDGRAQLEGQGSERRAIRFIGTAMDITDRKRLAAELQEHAAGLDRLVRERTAELREAMAELEHFSYTITHDMRAPLRAMRGFGTLLLNECAQCLPENQRDMLRRITEAAERMDHLITDALQYSRVVRLQMELEPLEPGPLLYGIVESYPQFQPPHAQILIQPDLPRVLANQAALIQVFSNLLGNAVKFVAPATPPCVQVRAEILPPVSPQGGASPGPAAVPCRVRFWVEDNGIGIASEYQHQIWEMFQRLDQAYEGTGIGLALVRKVVERLGGQVGLESEPGRGSRFWFDLPLADAPQAP